MNCHDDHEKLEMNERGIKGALTEVVSMSLTVSHSCRYQSIVNYSNLCSPHARQIRRSLVRHYLWPSDGRTRDWGLLAPNETNVKGGEWTVLRRNWGYVRMCRKKPLPISHYLALAYDIDRVPK